MTIRKLKVRVLAFCVARALLCSGAASADGVKVMNSGGFVSAYRELGPQFEDATGHMSAAASNSRKTDGLKLTMAR